MAQTELQRQAVEVVQKSWDTLNKLYCRSLPCPTVSFNLRGRTAGTANTRKNHIRLNAQLLEENGQAFLDRTPAHEAAHIFADLALGIEWTRTGRRCSHGRKWQCIMRNLGLDPTRCHSYDTSKTKRFKSKVARSFVYACGCMTFNLTQIRHRRILQGKTYRCLKCKNAIHFVEIAA